MSLPVPTLRESGLLLRAPRVEDADAVTAACQDPEISRWTRVPSPYTRAHALEFIATTEADARDGAAIGLLAFDDADRLLGSISLLDLHAAPDYGEIGYWLAAGARGRGIAARGVRTLTDWAHRELGRERLEIIVHRDNTGSHPVPLRAGYERLPGLHPLLRLGETDPVFVRYLSRGR